MGIRTSREVQQAIGEQTGRIEQRLVAIRKDITDVGSPVRNAIKRHPARAIGIGVGAGVALGILMSRSLTSQAAEDELQESRDGHFSPPRRTGKLLRLLLPLLMDYGFKFLTRDKS